MHVIVHGIGRQLLFEAEEDYAYYLDALEKNSRDLHVTVCAYCLMEDHVHLLMYDPEQRIPTLMKKLGVRYWYYFNRKYVRIGPVFGDRYRSEAANHWVTVFFDTFFSHFREGSSGFLTCFRTNGGRVPV